MFPLITVIAGASLACLLTYKYIVEPAFVSPLSKIPLAHPLCAISSKWFAYQRRKERELVTLYAAHQKHGQIVRLGPNEVSVASREGLRQIYTAGLEKDSWYVDTGSFYNYGTQNLVSMLDHKTHSTQKRMIASLYANSYIQHSSDVDQLSRRIVFDRLLPLFVDSARKGEVLNVVDLFQWVGADFMTAYLFGSSNSTDFLKDKEGRARYFDEWKQLRDADTLGKKDVMERVNMNMCKAVIAAQSDGEQRDGTEPIVFMRLYSQMSEVAKGAGTGLSKEEVLRRCASEMMDHIIAAHETTGTTLTYVLYRLSLDPALQMQLRSELLTLEPAVTLPESETESTGLPQVSAIDNLPLLNAVLYETLRVHAAAPCRQPRIVPPGGIMLHGHHIPAGTTVSCNPYTLHRQEDVFPQPFEWMPQRWMPSPDSEKGNASLEEMKRWFWAFGSGGRMCIGSNFAVQGEYLFSSYKCGQSGWS